MQVDFLNPGQYLNPWYAPRDIGPFSWLLLFWLLYVLAVRLLDYFGFVGSKPLVVGWPIVVMAWSLHAAQRLHHAVFGGHYHGVNEARLFMWYDLVGIAWSFLWVLAILTVGFVLYRHGFVVAPLWQTGVLGALAALGAVIYCWFMVAVVISTPLVLESARVEWGGT